MMNNQGSLAETKEILRSLVISSPSTVSIYELNRDFRNSEGYPIPYGRLGFPNLELFLRSLTDTLYVESNGNVRAIESSKSKHIDQMVAKQKSATRARKNDLEYRQNSPLMRQQPNNNYYNYQNTQKPPLLPNPHPAHHQYNQFIANQQHLAYITNMYGSNPVMQRINQLQFPMMSLPPQLVNRNLLARPTYFPHPLQSKTYNNHRQNHNNISIQNTSANSNKNIVMPTETIKVSSTESTTINKLVVEPPDEECQLTNSEEEQINDAMERLKLSTKQKYNEVEEEKNDESDAALPELSDFDPIFQINVPSNVVPYGSKIKRAELSPDIMKIGSKFSIWVTEIHNPTKFWFHLADHVESFDVLMKDIAQYYNNSDKDYQVTSANIRKGQLCAAQFLGIWHRAEIVSGLLEEAKVKVFFIDYGTTATLDVKYVKYLLKPFANLPSQVYRGALAGIKPLHSHRWDRDTTYFMLSLVMDIIIQAKVVDIDYENQVISLFMIDTNNSIDVHISNELISNGYAIAENQPWSSQANLTKTSIFYKIYPTFEMLERGEYPSFFEIGLYLADGFDLYKFEDVTIIPGIDVSPHNVNKNLTAGVKSTLNPLSVSWYPRQ